MIWAGGLVSVAVTVPDPDRCSGRGSVPDLVAGQGQGLAFAPDFVEPGGEPFGQTAGIGEHDGGLVLGDQVDDLLFDVRPDGRRLRARAQFFLAGRGQRRHVLHRDGDREVPRLLGGRGDNLHRGVAAQEPGNGIQRLHRGGEADPLGRPRQHRVQPFQRERQVRAAFGPGHGVHLVDDHGVHRGKGLPRLGRQHQEQRFRGGDQDVRRMREQPAALVGRGVAGTDAHGDGRGGQFQPFGGLGDADQRRAQVPFHVHAQRLQRRNVEHAGAAGFLLAPSALRRRVREVKRERRLRLRRGDEGVQRPEEGRQRLAGTGRRHHQGVGPGGDGVPGAGLRVSGRAERAGEPLAGRRAEAFEHRRRHTDGLSLTPGADGVQIRGGGTAVTGPRTCPPSSAPPSHPNSRRSSARRSGNPCGSAGRPSRPPHP